MIPDKLRKIGCTSTSTYLKFRCETIYVQDGKYYPTICNGYKYAAKCNTIEEAHKVINLIKGR